MQDGDFQRPWATPLEIGPIRLESRLALAPMSGVSTLAARLIAAEAGAGLVVTETISARALLRGTAAAEAKLQSGCGEDLRAVQLFGSEPADLAWACERLVDRGVRWIDLNAGCPVPKFIRQGAGSALLRDPLRLARILRSMRRQVPGVLSLKMRSGWDARSCHGPEIARLAASEGIDLLTVHGRTRAQQYRGHSDPARIREVVEAVPQLPVLANGDVTCAEDVPRLLEATGAIGVMIGRGAIGNPWIFEDALARGNAGSAGGFPGAAARLATLERHVVLVARSTTDPEGRLRELRRYSVAYSKGLPGGRHFRVAAQQTTDPEQLVALARDFLSSPPTPRAAAA